MSVISSLCTPEGFVIGSDGRKSSTDPPGIISDDTQKIFPIDRPGIRLAYGLFGTIMLGQDPGRVLYDFESEIARAIEEIGNQPKNFWGYLTALMMSLTQSLNKAREGPQGVMSTNERGTWIFVGGFYGKFQKLGHIAFSHGLQHTTAEPHNYPAGFSFPFGSPKVFELMNDGDARFAKYSHPPRQGIRTLAAGIQRVRNDILAHYDPEGLKVDEPSCSGIGGRIQIATVTLSRGFRWVPGFESATAQPITPLPT